MNGKKLEQQATILRDQGKGYEAVKLYTQAKAAYLKTNDKARAAGCQHMIGVAYKIENDSAQAFPAYEQAIKDYKTAHDQLGEGRVERDIGIMYEYGDNFEKAEEHLLKSEKALKAAPESAVTTNGDKRDAELGITLAKVGLVATRTAHYEKAERYLINGLTTIRKAGHPFYEMTALMHLGSLYFATNHYGRMIANLEAALGLIYEYNMYAEQTRRLAQIYGLLAHGYINSNNRETARYFAEKSFSIIKTLSESAQGPVKKDIGFDLLERQLHPSNDAS